MMSMTAASSSTSSRAPPQVGHGVAGVERAEGGEFGADAFGVGELSAQFGLGGGDQAGHGEVGRDGDQLRSGAVGAGQWAEQVEPGEDGGGGLDLGGVEVEFVGGGRRVEAAVPGGPLEDPYIGVVQAGQVGRGGRWPEVSHPQLPTRAPCRRYVDAHDMESYSRTGT
ncbi:hypothetical protein ACFQ1I_39210 [Kitasatospora arboriphila]